MYEAPGATIYNTNSNVIDPSSGGVDTPDIPPDWWLE